MELALEPAVNLAVGVSGFKSGGVGGPRQYSHEDLVGLVSGAAAGNRQRLSQSGPNAGGGQAGGIKMEPVGGANEN